MKKVGNFMKRKVVYFKLTDSVFKVAKVLSKRHISGAPVVNKGKVVGVISEADIIKFMSLKLSDMMVFTHEVMHEISLSLLLLHFMKIGRDQVKLKDELKRISKTEVRHMMSRDVVSVDSDTNLFEAAGIMEKFDIDRLPVIDNGKLVGIVTRADLIRALIE